jgi:hypothetical protein
MAEAMSRKIAESTKDGDELVAFAERVWRDPTMPFDDRRWAFEWLADRLAGKAMAKIEVGGNVTHTVRPNLEDYTFEEMDQIERINARALERKQLSTVIDASGIEVKP